MNFPEELSSNFTPGFELSMLRMESRTDWLFSK